MSDQQTRRAFMVASGAVGVTGVARSGVAAQPPNPNPPLPPMGLIIPGVRENVAGMGDAHPTVRSYRKAVAEMKRRSQADPTDSLGWTFQANMHGLPRNGGQHRDWGWCQHGNWWFLPWHRGYLLFFEDIVRKLSGDDHFRLPYWAWDEAGQNALPAPFRDPNPLFEASRQQANLGRPLRPDSPSGSFQMDWANARRTPRFVGATVELSFGGIRQPKTALPDKPASTDAHGVVESQAHDLIHDALSGIMGSPRTAAADPIFWLHHANVDRLWNRWLDDRTHGNPPDADWADQQFPYYDGTGARVVVSVAQILARAQAVYRYDEEVRRPVTAVATTAPPKGDAVPPTVQKVASVQPMLALGSTPLTKRLGFAADARQRVMTALAPQAAPVADPPAVILQVENITPPAETDVVYEVYVARAGDPADQRHYIGPISFFGRRADDHGHAEAGGHGHAVPAAKGFTQGFDVTELVERLRRANGGTIPELDVTIVPRSTAGVSPDELAKRKISIPITDVSLKLVTVGQ